MQKKQTLLSIAAVALIAAAPTAWGQAQNQGKLKVGFMLPATGTFASLGTAIDNGFRLYVTEQGGKIAGREVEYVRVDDESDPSKATDNVNKLIKRDNVDVIVGTVHSGVAMAMAKAAKESGTLLVSIDGVTTEISGMGKGSTRLTDSTLAVIGKALELPTFASIASALDGAFVAGEATVAVTEIDQEFAVSPSGDMSNSLREILEAINAGTLAIKQNS